MSRHLGQGLGSIYQLAVPLTVSIFCVLLSMLPFGLSSGIVITPAFALMAVFYWGLYRPDLMPPYIVFVIGFAEDLLSGGPLGLWALIYLIVYAIVVSQRLFFIGRAFMSIWIGFGVITLLVAALVWLIGSIYFGTLLSPLPALAQAVASFVLYPIFGRLFAGVQRVLIAQA